MKLLGLIISFICSLSIFGQVKSDKTDPKNSSFSLSLNFFNHADWLMKGQTTYVLTESRIKVVNTSFGTKKGKVIFSKKMMQPNGLKDSIINLNLVSLEDNYSNWCIMTTSGNEYFINFSSAQQDKDVWLHHYYLKQIDDLVHLINSYLPQKYQFQYLSKDTEQDCKP
jgi:hypothetical protein